MAVKVKSRTRKFTVAVLFTVTSLAIYTVLYRHTDNDVKLFTIKESTKLQEFAMLHIPSHKEQQIFKYNRDVNDRNETDMLSNKTVNPSQQSDDTPILREEIHRHRRDIMNITNSKVQSRSLMDILRKRRQLEMIAVNDRLHLTPRSNEELHDDFNYSLMTICEVVTAPPKLAFHYAYHSLYKIRNRTQTAEDCRSTCHSHDTTYASLMRGACYCYNTPRPQPQVNLQWCDATCTDEDILCNLSTKYHSITMRTGMKDGFIDWTIWMKIPDENVQVRYRGCQRNKNKPTNCTAEFQREYLSKPSTDRPVSKELIGCFTGRSIKESPLAVMKRVHGGSQSYYTCQQICSQSSHTYAAVTTEQLHQAITRECYCVNSLSQSQPTDSCRGLGVAVYLSKETSSPVLKFDGEVEKKGKVLVLARYRSGSSMTQSFFIKNPNSFSLFEPCKLQAGNAEDKADRATLMALEAFYSCDPYRISIFLHNTPFIVWSSKMIMQRGGLEDNHLLHLIDCYNTTPKIDCLPYWKEACDRAAFMDTKVIKVFDTQAISEFTQRNPDVHVIHLVRDPRSLMAAQRKYGTLAEPRALCNQLLQVGEVIRGLKEGGARNVHEVFYEQLAVDASKYGAKIYQEIGIEMPEQVSHFLKRADYRGVEIPMNASQVVVDDPIYHRYRFLEIYSVKAILSIDANCQNVYRFWPTHYTDFLTMVKYHGQEVYKYSSKENRADIFRVIHPIEKNNRTLS